MDIVSQIKDLQRKYIFSKFRLIKETKDNTIEAIIKLHGLREDIVEYNKDCYLDPLELEIIEEKDSNYERIKLRKNIKINRQTNKSSSIKIISPEKYRIKNGADTCIITIKVNQISNNLKHPDTTIYFDFFDIENKKIDKLSSIVTFNAIIEEIIGIYRISESYCGIFYIEHNYTKFLLFEITVYNLLNGRPREITISTSYSSKSNLQIIGDLNVFENCYVWSPIKYKLKKHAQKIINNIYDTTLYPKDIIDVIVSFLI